MRLLVFLAVLAAAIQSPADTFGQARPLLATKPRIMSDATTQDGEPQLVCFPDGNQLVLWRGFTPPLSTDPAHPSRLGSDGRDLIRARVVTVGGLLSEPFDLFETPADIETLSAVLLDDSSCQLVWAEQREQNWDLFTTVVSLSRRGPECGDVLRLTNNPGVDRAPVLKRAADGTLFLIWQGWRNGRSSIFSRELRNQTWSEKSTRLSSRQSNDWNPALAVANDGTVAAAWSTWRDGSYDIHMRIRADNEWGPAMAVASGDEYEAHPALAYDRQDVLWIAYEDGGPEWGMDSHNAGLRSLRNVKLRLYRNKTLEEPTESTALTLPEEFRDTTEMPHLAVDGRGVLWLFFRHLSGRGMWTLVATSLVEEGWSAPRTVPKSPAGQDIAMASAPMPDGPLAVAWVTDGRSDPVAEDSYVYEALLQSPESRPARISGELATATIRDASPSSERNTRSFGKKKLSLFFGDLHRHTELSVCQTGRDSSLQDAYRYAIDAAGLDFLCITDHVQHIKTLNDYDYWRSGKTADLNRVPGLHEPLYGYERSQRWPFGHRNVISPTRDPLRVPRTADNRPWSANSGYPGEVRLTPPELWERLAGENVITIPHSSGSPVMGTNFGSAPGALEPVVEIYQGCRYSYEYKEAPDPRRERDGAALSGGMREGGAVWDALDKGYRYGFIASSDHVATHNSYSCVWAEDFSPASILQAIANRQCYAATDKIVCDVRMGEHMMGSQFSSPEVPPMRVKIAGTSDIERVDIIKDNRIVHTYTPEHSTSDVVFTYSDADATPGTHYYYARVIQIDRNMAWVSPIWVDVE